MIHTARFWPDKLYLEIVFYLRMGYRLNLDNPQTFSEKIQWLKLHYKRPDLPMMVDKVTAKKYVADIIGKDHIIPTLKVFDTVDDIKWDILPKQFVIKCTHDSGGLVVCKNKEELDINQVKKKLKKGLRHSYYWINREWPYKSVPHRLIVEQYMEDESGYELKDYKFFCFNGEPKALFVASDRGRKDEETKFDFFDMDFNHLPFTNGHPNASKSIVKPKGFDEMKEIAKRLAKGFPHIRVDLYDVNGHIYFGELTFFHWSGMVPFSPKEWDYRFGKWIMLPDVKSSE